MNSHTLVFTPSGFGAGLGSQLRIQLPRAVAVTAGGNGGLRTTNEVEWTVPPGSTLRLQQLLAEAGYLPVDWRPTGSPVARTPSAQAQAAVDPPNGSFSWRYPNTPHQLQAMWSPGQANVITRGAVMKFENGNNLTVDGLAGTDRVAGADQRRDRGQAPERRLQLRLRTPGSPRDHDAVARRPHDHHLAGEHGHLRSGNRTRDVPGVRAHPRRHDERHQPRRLPLRRPGIKWISYFNGGDALHNFDRASFGTPQSLGCVELPLAASAEIWPYTPIGTLVTIEN